MLITGTLQKWSEINPEHVAIKAPLEKRTYRELFGRVMEMAQYFRSLQQEGKIMKAAILLPNSAVFLECFLGVAEAGWMAVPIDYKWTEKEVKDRFQQCAPDVLITDSSYLKKAAGLAPHVVNLSEQGSFSCKREEGADALDLHVSGNSPFHMGFTSGSTGAPKCFIRNHQSWVKSFACSAEEFGISEHDRVLVPGPLVHSHFLFAAISTLFLGGTVYLLTKFSPLKTSEWIADYEINVLYMVPTMIVSLVKEKAAAAISLKKLISSGAKWEQGLKQSFQTLYPHVRFYEFYGASELSFVSFLEHGGNEEKHSSVGKPFHNVSVSIRRENGEEAARDEVGTLYVKSELVFMEYYESPAETDKVFQDGWVTVGDLAKMDGDGYLYIAGRKSDMMITGGLNVYPEEIESVLLQMENIEEAVVTGMADPYWGEVIAAVIKPVKGRQMTKSEITTFCRKQLANYKVPRRYVFTDQIPYTTSGKPARSKVKEMLL